MEDAFLALGVVSVTELLKRVKASDWEGVAVIVVAVLLGVFAGWQHVQGIANIGDGVVLALGAVGIHTVARQVG